AFETCALPICWVDSYGAVIFGDRNEIACIPHEGCRLEITATAPSPHRKAELLLPGQVMRYMHSLFLGDRFVLPNGRKVKLQHLVGFKLQLASRPGPLPLEDVVTRRLAFHQRAAQALSCDESDRAPDQPHGRLGLGCWRGV